jgi:hypothetical protein
LVSITISPDLSVPAKWRGASAGRCSRHPLFPRSLGNDTGNERLFCAVSDCRFVAFRIQDGHYEVRIEGWSYVVPAEIIIGGIVNPTARAATFGPPFQISIIAWGSAGVPHDRPQDSIEILCFVPPRLPS